MHLQMVGVDLEQEDDDLGFFGVNLDQESNTGLLYIKQTGLIQHIIEAIVLDNGTVKGKFTPSEKRPLVKDSNGEPPIGMFRYSNVVGILLYLPVHNCTDIDFDINFYARYMFCPNRFHDLA